MLAIRSVLRLSCHPLQAAPPLWGALWGLVGHRGSCSCRQSPAPSFCQPLNAPRASSTGGDRGRDCAVGLLGDPMEIAPIWSFTLILIQWSTSEVGRFIVPLGLDGFTGSPRENESLRTP